MSVIGRLASSLGRSDEPPNQELAAELAGGDDRRAIKELIENLRNTERAIQSDCIKVLYEIGARKPELIAPYVNEFLDQLSSKNNRMIWGAMTALGTIAPLKADAIWKRVDVVVQANNAGSVITQDWGIRVLAAVSAKRKPYEKKIFSYLMAFLRKCIPRDVPKHAESILVAVNAGNRGRFERVLREREKELNASQKARLRKVSKKLEVGD